MASHVPQATAAESEATAPPAVEPQRSRIGEIASEHSGWIGVLVAAVPAVLATAKLGGVAKFDAQNMLILMGAAYLAVESIWLPSEVLGSRPPFTGDC